MVGTKLKRTNWGRGEPLERLTKAVEDWDAKSGLYLTEKPAMLMPEYAKCVGIPYETLSSYCCKDVGKRKELGKSVGKQTLFNTEEEQFAVDVVRRHDRGNDGLNKRECVDVLHDLKPEATRSAGTCPRLHPTPSLPYPVPMHPKLAWGFVNGTATAQSLRRTNPPPPHHLPLHRLARC